MTYSNPGVTVDQALRHALTVGPGLERLDAGMLLLHALGRDATPAEVERISPWRFILSGSHVPGAWRCTAALRSPGAFTGTPAAALRISPSRMPAASAILPFSIYLNLELNLYLKTH